MSEQLCLRVRFPTKVENIRCSADVTYGELKALVARAGGMQEETLRCSHSFPPLPLELSDEAPIAGTLNNMDTLIVLAEGASGQAVAPSKGKGSKPPKASPKHKSSSSLSQSPQGLANVATLHDGGESGGSTRGSKKRAAAQASSSKGVKRRAAGALHLGSEESIGESLVNAVSSRKGLAALSKEDPAIAFFKAAAASALTHHQEEVLANDRYKAVLAEDYEIKEISTSRRADGTYSEAAAHFKVGRKRVDETFELLSVPELRGVIQAVLDRFEADTSGRSLLNPFKMSLVSPRVFWNLVHHHGRDIPAGLRALLPNVDWSFLGDRERRASSKAAANSAQAAQEEEEKRHRREKRQEKAAAKARSLSAQQAGGGKEELSGSGLEPGQDGLLGAAEQVDEEEVKETESDPGDPEGWEARGLRAMLDDKEYDFACTCLSRALLMRIDEARGDEQAPALARPWYLHGSALLRRAQSMKILISKETAGTATSNSSEIDHVAAREAGANLPDGWVRAGSAAIGRRVRRFYAMHGACDGTVVGWLPPSKTTNTRGDRKHHGCEGTEPMVCGGDGADDERGKDEGDDGEVALWRVVHDDGDVEDLEEDELEEALAAHREDRSLAQEAELGLEAGWEALEMAIFLYTQAGGNDIPLVEAHERLADASLLNEQPLRALEELHKARTLLHTLRDTSSLPPDDRRLADVEFSLGIAQLQAGNASAATAHYHQAARVLSLRKAKLERSLADAKIAKLSGEVDGVVQPCGTEGCLSQAEEDEIKFIGEIIGDIENRLNEIRAASSSTC